ncbi:hypothetical protein ACFWY9_21710 [Amycolatopsis sp. NPDC059027]|uniref:hypothetical protein n=1 Tax=unclassified Amycolatopsis TaxID=2618356 RepID=UPI00366CED77
MGRLVLGAVIVGAAVFAVWRPRRLSGTPLRGRGNPVRWLLAVIALLYLNQVLFTVYVDRVHHGDATFISRYVPPGWFDLAGLGPIPGWFPEPGLLSVSLFRVSSFLELPFVVFAYLTVCRWLDAGAYRRAVRLVWPASVAYTITFCLIEWELRNPWTTQQDLLIRAASGIAVPLWVSRFAGDTGRRVRSLPDLLLFLVSAGALGWLVLAVYDSALLYNLGHVPAVLPGAVIATAVLVPARVLARRVPDRRAGPGLTVLIRSAKWLAVVFFVPALAIRYGLNFGLPALATVAGVTVVVAALVLGTGRAPGRALLGELAAALLGGAVLAGPAYLLAGGYPEARLLAAATAFLAGVITVCAFVDRRAAPVADQLEGATSSPPNREPA